MLTVNEKERFCIQSLIAKCLTGVSEYENSYNSITFETEIPKELPVLLDTFFPKVLTCEIILYIDIIFDVEITLLSKYISVQSIDVPDKIIPFEMDYICEYGCYYNYINCDHPIPRIIIENIGTFEMNYLTLCVQELDNLEDLSETGQKLINYSQMDEELVMNTFQVISWFVNIANSCIKK